MARPPQLGPNPHQVATQARIDEPYVLEGPGGNLQEIDPIRLVAFNLHQGRKILRILGALQHHPELKDAHVVALQEVDRFNGRTGGVDLSGLLARETRRHSVYGVEFIELNRRGGAGGGDHGNQTLTRFEVKDPAVITLPQGFDWTRSKTLPRLGRRMALVSHAPLGGLVLRIINAHLEVQCLPRKRLEQLETILEWDAAHPHPGPSVLLGDMNTFVPREPARFRMLAASFGYEDALPTRPRGTWGGVFRLDWILVKNLEIVSAGICRDVRGSDHKPVWCTVRLPRQAL